MNGNLVDRGDLTVWLDTDCLGVGRQTGKGVGKGRPYPQPVIDLPVTVLYHLPLRQAQGFVGTLNGLLGVVADAPGYTTICRRRKSTVLPAGTSDTTGMVLVMDATGVTMRSPGPWIKEKWTGEDKRKTRFVKLHIGIDQQTGCVLASVVTPADGAGSGDSTVGPELIRQAGTGLAGILADKAYDNQRNYQAAEKAGTELYTVPKADAVYGLHPHRDIHLAQIGRIGPNMWKARVGYGQRAQVESWFSGFKRATSDRTRARSFEGARAEITAAVTLYSRMLTR